MHRLVKPIVALAVLVSLGACATVDCPPGTHPGPYMHRCHPDRPMPPPP